MTLSPNFFIIAILRVAYRSPVPVVGPPADSVPQLVRFSQQSTLLGQSVLSCRSSLSEKNREPRRAILRLATNRKSSRYKASALFLPRLIPPSWAGRDFSRRLLSRRFASASYFWPFTWLLYVAHYRLVKANIRPENCVRQRHFPFRYSMRYSFCRWPKKSRYCDISMQVL